MFFYKFIQHKVESPYWVKTTVVLSNKHIHIIAEQLVSYMAIILGKFLAMLEDMRIENIRVALGNARGYGVCTYA